jgi:hypothetical protein
MRFAMVAAWSAALLASPSLSSADDVALPTLSPAQMNCADTAVTGDPKLSPARANEIRHRLQAVWMERANTRDRDPGSYVIAFCSTTVAGRSFIVLNGIYSSMGVVVCDDAAGFGVLYDVEKKTFGDILFGVSSCAPGAATGGRDR